MTACIFHVTQWEWHFTFVIVLPPNPFSWSNHEKNETNLNWRICYKILGQHASKLFRSSKTEKVWETVRDQERLRRRDRERWCGSLDGVLQQKEDTRGRDERNTNELWSLKPCVNVVSSAVKRAPHKPEMLTARKRGWGYLDLSVLSLQLFCLSESILTLKVYLKK